MKLNRDPRFKQGIFTPKHQHKFIGSKAVYRSSFELKFFRWADENSNVLVWGSENIIVPYISPVDGKAHRYYVDNFVVIKEGAQTKKYLIEIKPFSQTQPPQTSKRKKQQTIVYEQVQWVVNNAKWSAAKAYAKKHDAEFLIITEKDLF